MSKLWWFPGKLLMCGICETLVFLPLFLMHLIMATMLEWSYVTDDAVMFWFSPADMMWISACWSLLYETNQTSGQTCCTNEPHEVEFCQSDHDPRSELYWRHVDWHNQICMQHHSNRYMGAAHTLTVAARPATLISWISKQIPKEHCPSYQARVQACVPLNLFAIKARCTSLPTV